MTSRNAESALNVVSAEEALQMIAESPVEWVAGAKGMPCRKCGDRHTYRYDGGGNPKSMTWGTKTCPNYYQMTPSELAKAVLDGR